MRSNRNSGNQQKKWQKTADAILLLGWRKLLLVLVLWMLTAVLTWAVFGVLDAFFSSPAGTDVVGFVRESLADGEAGWMKNGRVGIVPTVIFVLGTAVIPLYLLAVLAYTIVRTQPRRRYLRLTPYTLLLVPAFILGVFLHNFVYAMFFPFFVYEDGDEGVFFLAALLGIPLYLSMVVLNTVIHFVKGRGAGTAGSL